MSGSIGTYRGRPLPRIPKRAPPPRNLDKGIWYKSDKVDCSTVFLTLAIIVWIWTSFIAFGLVHGLWLDIAEILSIILCVFVSHNLGSIKRLGKWVPTIRKLRVENEHLRIENEKLLQRIGKESEYR